MVTEYEVYGAMATQRAHINFLKWHTLIFPYIKNIHDARKNIRRWFWEIFLVIIFRREVITNHSSGEILYFEKLDWKQYYETIRDSVKRIWSEISYIKQAKKKIREYENEKI